MKKKKPGTEKVLVGTRLMYVQSLNGAKLHCLSVLSQLRCLISDDPSSTRPQDHLVFYSFLFCGLSCDISKRMKVCLLSPCGLTSPSQ